VHERYEVDQTHFCTLLSCKLHSDYDDMLLCIWPRRCVRLHRQMFSLKTSFGCVWYGPGCLALLWLKVKPIVLPINFEATIESHVHSCDHGRQTSFQYRTLGSAALVSVAYLGIHSDYLLDFTVADSRLCHPIDCLLMAEGPIGFSFEEL
jgi:hypothetical protein